ncbi:MULTISPECIES: cobalamin biosynthesis protein [Methanosarcina]|jgi:adenosylcobinamide-phosphate synthase|uniref:Probable cobalamin biosynthesis protein CobD n=7 Tax=Methanosarcina mazei TaxID=2209 RepID=A0A0F8T063_METMZ|nr:MULTISPECIES: cobalamin biosynthesis protein [Methanosarcina]AAM31755.1 CbiB protein [Methanosarcina mazei Go1]AGF97454.1 Adenosylcobinamide-phosphate synthase [Methanosarcina mazei Tuc01]AKB41572.1 Adenosylcobinamide-phosphate synthase [Methanosarcina mazei WWM610]AKB65823.1 Adenosylcobinamide-phosphate synthase [Methanosarcina mazei S-6]AKB69038.1 Adenosylcobinamide-phosphate synthase [Methanosarcina mazei LYC]
MIIPDSGHLALVLLLAAVIDIVFGEPPAAVHPVVWIGKLISFLKNAAPKNHRKLYGTAMALFCVLFASLLGYSVLYIAALPGIPGFLALLIEAYFLKATFAINCLLSPAREIYKHLEENRLEKVRELLPIYVSRNTSKLTKNQMSSAVVESVSENYVDGILSPIFYYAVFGEYGLVAAYAFKAISTLDSMVGYKTEPYKELGYFSAKSDDVLNWIPARISVIFILAAAFTVSLFPKKGRKINPFDSVKTALKDGMKTPSPNSGYPMAATAGALGVKLEKPNTYVLGASYPPTEIKDIKRVSQLIAIASGFSLVAFVAVIRMAGIYLHP